jgi:hypothetical protein
VRYQLEYQPGHQELPDLPLHCFELLVAQCMTQKTCREWAQQKWFEQSALQAVQQAQALVDHMHLHAQWAHP